MSTRSVPLQSDITPRGRTYPPQTNTVVLGQPPELLPFDHLKIKQAGDKHHKRSRHDQSGKTSGDALYHSLPTALKDRRMNGAGKKDCRILTMRLFYHEILFQTNPARGPWAILIPMKINTPETAAQPTCSSTIRIDILGTWNCLPRRNAHAQDNNIFQQDPGSNHKRQTHPVPDDENPAHESCQQKKSRK